jgi:putative ABC transport system permease protein
MLAAFQELVTRVSGKADLTVQRSGTGVPAELVGELSELPGVSHVASSLEVSAQAPELGEAILVLGVDFLGDLHFLPFKVDGGDDRVIEDPLAFVNDPTALLVARKFAARHGLQKDSRIQLLTSDGPKDFFVRGIVEDEGPASAFGGQVVVMFIDAAQVSFARGTMVDRIDVALTEGASAKDVQASIRKIVGPDTSVDVPEQIGTRLRDLAEPLRAGLGISGLLALLVGAFLVYNAVGVAVAQRSREIGILRALGLTRRKVVALFCAEAALVALPGIVIGLGLGRVLSTYSTASTIATLNQFFAPVAPVEVTLTPRLVAEGMSAGLLTAVLAAFWPARRGAAIDPAIVLRGAASVERSRVRTVPLLAGGLLLIAAAWLPLWSVPKKAGAFSILFTVVGAAMVTPALVTALRRALVPVVERALGLPARLGLDYVERTLGRSTVSVLALMVAVSMSVSVGGWLASFERSIVSWAEQMGVSDLAVTQGSAILDRQHVALGAGALERVQKVPGVVAVQPFRIVEQRLGGRTFRLVATDTDAFFEGAARRGKAWPVVEGEPIQKGELSAAPKVLLAENAARLLGVGVGDSLTLHTPRGTLDVKIRAIVVDYTSRDGAAFLDRRHYLDHWGDDAVDSMGVFIDDPKNEGVIIGKIRAALGGGKTVFVSGMAGLKQQLLDTLPQLFAYSRSVELVTLLIALMGVVGTMVAAVIDRSREIGTLRAIGATPRQVATSIVVEAAFLGVCAVVAGVGVGAIECLVFLKKLFAADTGWHLDYVFPWLATLRIGGLVVATSALAGGLPALRAARADAKGALVYE